MRKRRKEGRKERREIALTLKRRLKIDKRLRENKDREGKGGDRTRGEGKVERKSALRRD